MDRRINNKTRVYLQQMKNDIKGVISKTDIAGTENANALLQFIYDYQPLEFTKTDFQKRKRVKNIVPYFERCCALRANGEQCTRRKKDSEKFCGTHIKGTPHGIITDKPPKKTHKEIDVWLCEIHGISYYIDAENNVYSHNDIINNIPNPSIIAKYVKDANGKINIPSLFGKK